MGMKYEQERVVDNMEVTVLSTYIQLERAKRFEKSLGAVDRL